MKKIQIIILFTLVSFQTIFAQKDTLKLSVNALASGILQTGQTSRLVTNTLVESQIKNKSFAWEHYSQYTYGTLGKSGSFPKTELENDFITTHVLKYKPSNKIFPALFPMYEFSNLRGINDRLAVSAGIGYNALTQENLKLEADLGAGYETTDFYINPNNESWRLLTRIKGFYKIQNSPLSFSAIGVYQPSLEDKEDKRFRALSKLNFKLGKHFGLNLIYAYIFEKVPDFGRQKQNSQLTYGINYQF